ncbi:MAG: N-terminal phage integrase SAM-like domain-containing protein [Proteobacteria bacterium]|nr:N-terminal phage integrase SAM-like domain-containing protein [Pseudomonadota bacterium]
MSTQVKRSEPTSRRLRRRTGNPDNLYRRGETWWIRYSVGGKLIRRSLATANLREARRLRDQILAKRSVAAKFGIKSPHVEPCKTFAQIAEMWLQSRQADDSLAPSTREQNARVVRGLLVPELGHMTMSAITVEDIERFIGNLRKTRARSTVATYYGCLRAIFRRAIRRGWFAGPNPFDRLERVPTQGPGRDTALTVDEAQRLACRTVRPSLL